MIMNDLIEQFWKLSKSDKMYNEANIAVLYFFNNIFS